MPTPLQPVTIEKVKWSGAISARWAAELRALRDGRLEWRAPAGTTRERPARDAPEILAEEELGVASGGWWICIARRDPTGAVLGYRVDACTPVARAGVDRLRFVDLDLDLALDPGGGPELVRLLDRSVFRRRARELGYPRRVRAGAEAGIEDALARFLAGRWPFDGSLAGPRG